MKSWLACLALLALGAAARADTPLLGGRLHATLPRGAVSRYQALGAVFFETEWGLQVMVRELYVVAHPDLAAVAQRVAPRAPPPSRTTALTVAGARAALRIAPDPVGAPDELGPGVGSIVERALVEMSDETVIQIDVVADRRAARDLRRCRAAAEALFASLAAAPIPLAPGGPVDIPGRPPIRMSIPPGYVLSSFRGPHGYAYRARRVIAPGADEPYLGIDFGLHSAGPKSPVQRVPGWLLGRAVEWIRHVDGSRVILEVETPLADGSPLLVTLMASAAGVEELLRIAGTMRLVTDVTDGRAPHQ